MKLSSKDWIYLWEGRLYAPPFVTRCLLYKINDPKSSLLVHHIPNVSPGSYSDSNVEPMKFTATENEVDDVYVHFALSNTISLKDIVNISPTRFKLSKSAPIRQSFGGLSLEIQKWQLGGNEMFGIGVPNGSNHEYRIENTPFQVQSPVPIVGLSQNFPNADAFCQLWKISIVNLADNKAYDVNCQKNWSVTAFRIKNSWQPILSLQLEHFK